MTIGAGPGRAYRGPMMRLLACCLALGATGFSLPTHAAGASFVSAQQNPGRQRGLSRRDAIRAAAEIARGAQVGDLAAIERLLGLTGLAAGVQWTDPPSWDHMSGRRGNFEVGSRGSPIRNVHMIRGTQLYLGGQYVAHDWLTIVFRDSSCPSLSDYEAIFGTFRRMMIPSSPHGGGSYDHRYLEIVSASGAKVTVAADQCSISLNMPSPVQR